MEAKDTVMSKEQISDAKKGHTAIIESHPSVFEDDIAIAQAQAEITWPIAKQEGRREVVEWVNRYSKINKNQYDEYWGYMVMELEDWQAKLKEWGIE